MSEPSQNSSTSSLENSSVANLALLRAALTVFALAGYGLRHPGLEDDAFYLAAIKRNLNPALAACMMRNSSGLAVPSHNLR